ncbi:MAG TPA: hypothetical protein VFN85_10230 [Solirubrobacterales bacterium]|nr:hypothetical protein [Solirubrobacterales bacterium]
MRSQASRGRRVGGEQGRRPSHGRRAANPVGDLKADMSIEQAQPGSALDDQLRREQAKAILALLRAYRNG